MYSYSQICGSKIKLLVSTLCIYAIYCNICDAICPPECLCQHWTGNVNCVGVGLWEIPMELPAKTNVLKLGSNFITPVNEDFFQNMADVEEIHLDRNLVQELPPNSFVQLTNLRILDLSHNQIASLPNEVFTGLNRLERLVLQGNTISEIHQRAFRPLSNLLHLDLYDNSLRKLPEGIFRSLKALQELDLGKSKLIAFASETTFRGLGNLTVLNLGENTELSALNTGLFLEVPSLKKLILQGCRLQGISSGMFDGLTALKELHLQHTGLRNTLPLQVFEKIPNLETIRIDNNHLTAIHESVLLSIQQSYGVVYLQQNNWQCSCGLINMRARWRDAQPEFLHSGITCQSPNMWNEQDLWSIPVRDLQEHCLKEVRDVQNMNLPRDSRVELSLECPIAQESSSVIHWITPEEYYISPTTVSLNGEFEGDSKYKLFDNGTLEINNAEPGSYMCSVTFASGKVSGAAYRVTFSEGLLGSPVSPEDSDESNITAFWLPIAVIVALVPVIVVVIALYRCRRAKGVDDQPYDRPFLHQHIPVKNVDPAYAYAYVSAPDGKKKKRDISAYAIAALFEFQLPEDFKLEDINNGYDKVKCQRPKSHSCRERGSKYPAPVPLPRPSHTIGSRGTSRAESCVYVTPANHGGMGMFRSTRVGHSDSEIGIPLYGGNQMKEIDPGLKRLRGLHSKSVNDAKRPKSNPYMELIA